MCCTLFNVGVFHNDVNQTQIAEMSLETNRVRVHYTDVVVKVVRFRGSYAERSCRQDERRRKAIKFQSLSRRAGAGNAQRQMDQEHESLNPGEDVCTYSTAHPIN